MMRTAGRPSPLIHFCWSNPCIEYWFWLHFSTETSLLCFDDELEVNRREERRPLENGDTEVITTRTVRPSIRPDTMLRILSETAGQYDKVKSPALFTGRIRTACDNHKTVSQTIGPSDKLCYKGYFK